MAISSSGSGMRDALANLVGVAQSQGGADAQDPAARALSAAGQMGGDTLSNLQRLGADNVFDDKIREIQSQAERSGWTDKSRSLVKDLRNFQSSGAQDAHSTQRVTFSGGGGGGGGGYSGGERQMAGGGLEMLAQLLGKYKGNSRYNDATQGVGINQQRRSALMSEDGAAIEELDPVYQEMLRSQRLQNDGLAQQLSQSSTAGMGGASGGSLGGMSGSDGQSGYQGTGGPLTMGGLQGQQQGGGIDKRIREAALAAALRAIGKF
jgi:hypothetical protein